MLKLISSIDTLFCLRVVFFSFWQYLPLFGYACIFLSVQQIIPRFALFGEFFVRRFFYSSGLKRQWTDSKKVFKKTIQTVWKMQHFQIIIWILLVLISNHP